MRAAPLSGKVGSLVLVGALAGAPATAAVELLLSLDPTAVPPGAVCEGTFEVSHGGRASAREWLHDATDSCVGDRFRFAAPHSPASAAASGRPLVYGSTIAAGLILDLEAPPEATLTLRTSLGEQAVALRDLVGPEPQTILAGQARLQRLPNVTALGGPDAEEEYPSVARLSDGRTAVAYVAWDGTADSLQLRIGDRARAIPGVRGDLLDPRLAVDGNGRLWCVWTAGDNGQWDLWAWDIDAAHADDPEAPGHTRALTRTPRNDFWPRLARDDRGRLWLAWQSVADDLHYEVSLAALSADGLGATTCVSEHPADDWEPAVCATADGRLAVAWDTYRNGSFDVYLREFRAGADAVPAPTGPPQPVAASAAREAHVTLAADSAQRLWLAWDTAGDDWGKHPRERATLHAARRVEVAVWAEGRLWRPAADLESALPAAWRRFVEYPQVAVDGAGRVWAVVRIENQVAPVYKKNPQARPQTYGLWQPFALQYDGDRWGPPLPLTDSNGRQDVRVDTGLDGDGHLLVVFGADARTRRLPYVPVDYGAYLASLAGLERPYRPPELVAAPAAGRVVPATADPELVPLPRRWEAGGAAYRLLLGDTHRHTDISRCANGHDGSLQDAYRYALDAVELDWLAISDHDQDILKHRNDRAVQPRPSYDWWRSQKYCDLYTIPGRFVALYGYEHGGSYQARGGHKNVVLATRGAAVVEADAPHELFAALAGSGALAIPHQLADGGSRMDWDRWSPEFERVGEIFQARGSYEFSGCPRAAPQFTAGNALWDALAKGVRIGIIASSDHGQMHQARAGVYVADTPAGFTRVGILDALRARRTFGATTAVAVQVTVAGRPQGEEVTLSGAPVLTARILATAPITDLCVVRDGRFVYATKPAADTAAFEYTDTELAAGQSAYYYVRATMGGNDFAWSSPLWVKRER